MRTKLLLFGFVSFTLISCTNVSQYTGSLSTLNTTIGGTSSSTIYTQVLKNVSVDALTTLAADGSSNLELTLSADTSQANYQPLTQFCGTGTTNPCECQMSFTQVTVSGGVSQSFARTKRVTATQVQSGLVKCDFASSFWNEITDATQITMSIIPVSPTNVTGLNVQPVIYKKGTSISSTGDFLDNTLTPFRNIHRYSCFSKWSNSYELLNAYQSIADPTGATTTPYNVLMASQFCGSSTSPGGSALCPSPRNGFSAQSYYRNLYVRSDNLGQINSTNASYDCPKVLETLQYSAGQPSPSPASGNYWPLDTTFALATDYSSDWSVGVPAASILTKSGDPNSVSTGCTNEDTTKRLSEYGITVKCLGYAKPPNANGTCGSITDSNGRVRPMTRLRRFRVIYPIKFT